MNTSLVIYRMPDTIGERCSLACHVLSVNGTFIKETHSYGEQPPADLLAMASNLSHALMVPIELRDTRPKPSPRIVGAGLRLVV
jgi:hypothetical protein